MFENPWIDLFELARGQWGGIKRSQARQLGIDDRTFTRRVRSEGWRQPHRGVYVIPGTTWGPMSRLSAALLAAGPSAAATGVTALHVHGVVEVQPARLHLVVPHGRRGRSLRGAVVVRSRTLRSDDLTASEGLRCTKPPRAFMDAAPEEEDDALRMMLIDGRQRNIVTPAEVIERTARSALRRPGCSRLLAVAADVAGIGADSVLVDRVHRRLLAEGLRPDPEPVRIAAAGRLLRPDITFAAARVCIEVDSLAHHADQRALDLDHRKHQQYDAAWWRCIRVGWRRYDHDWVGFVAVLRRALDQWPAVVAAHLG